MEAQFKDWLSMTRAACAGMQKLAVLNLDTARNLLETGFDPAHKQLSALPDRLAQTMLAWSQSACDISGDTLDAMLEHAPAGPVCATIGLWKSAVDAVDAGLRTHAA